MIVVELKRYGGRFPAFDILDREISIQTARSERRIPNPSARLAEKSKRLVQEMLTDEGWVRLKRLFSAVSPDLISFVTTLHRV